MKLKIWPDGDVICEDEWETGGAELTYGHSDDYFTIDMDKLEYYEAIKVVRAHFQAGEQLEAVIAEVAEYYGVAPAILTTLDGDDIPE